MLHLCGDVIIETAKKKKRNKMLMSWLFFLNLFVWISFENVQAVR